MVLLVGYPDVGLLMSGRLGVAGGDEWSPWGSPWAGEVAEMLARWR